MHNLLIVNFLVLRLFSKFRRNSALGRTACLAKALSPEPTYDPEWPVTLSVCYFRNSWFPNGRRSTDKNLIPLRALLSGIIARFSERIRFRFASLRRLQYARHGIRFVNKGQCPNNRNAKFKNENAPCTQYRFQEHVTKARRSAGDAFGTCTRHDYDPLREPNRTN